MRPRPFRRRSPFRTLSSSQHDRGAEIVLGVSGGIAAYKACELLREFTEHGHHVSVVATNSALNFVGSATWAALSGRPVATDVFENVHEVPHVALGRAADLVIIAPATADVMARAAAGRADDLLTATLLTARCPVVFVPAMHTEMWQHPATVDNVATLRRRGCVVIEPDSGRLTGVDTGKGRLPDPAELFSVATHILSRPQRTKDLAGQRILVTAGGCHEPLDPVRFIANRSSGKQGYAVARAAVARGAEVHVIAANVVLADPAGVEVSRVETTAELAEATARAAPDSDVIVMAAAPADFTPKWYASTKIKKTSDNVALSVDLVHTPDIAAQLGTVKRSDQLLVTFAAETNDGINHARDKMKRKNADLMVLNEVGDGKAFGTDNNAVTLLRPDVGSVQEVDSASKDEIADHILDSIVALNALGREHSEGD